MSKLGSLPGNQVSMVWNQVEFLTTFGTITAAGYDLTRPGAIEVSWLVSICQSPIAFKRMALSMAEAVASYEAQYGAIPTIPPQMEGAPQGVMVS